MNATTTRLSRTDLATALSDVDTSPWTASEIAQIVEGMRSLDHATIGERFAALFMPSWVWDRLAEVAPSDAVSSGTDLFGARSAANQAASDAAWERFRGLCLSAYCVGQASTVGELAAREVAS